MFRANAHRRFTAEVALGWVRKGEKRDVFLEGIEKDEFACAVDMFVETRRYDVRDEKTRRFVRTDAGVTVVGFKEFRLVEADSRHCLRVGMVFEKEDCDAEMFGEDELRVMTEDGVEARVLESWGDEMYWRVVEMEPKEPSTSGYRVVLRRIEVVKGTTRLGERFHFVVQLSSEQVGVVDEYLQGILAFYNRLSPVEFDDLHLSPLQESLVLTIQRQVGKIPPGVLRRRPVPFNRSFYPVTYQGGFVVSPNLTGRRMKLFSVNQQLLFVTPDVQFSLTDYDFLPTILEDQTLLDGTLCRDVNTHNPVYFVTDVLLLRGHDCLKLPFEARLREIRAIVAAFNAAKAQCSAEDIFFDLDYKSYIDTPHILNALASCNKELTLTKQHNHLVPIDGLVLDPTRVPLENANSLWWNFAHKRSLNFGVKAMRGKRGDELVFFCKDKDRDVIFRPVDFTPSNAAQFAADQARFEWDGRAIVECCFDSKRGVWRYMRYRWELTDPDPIEKAMEILEVNAMNITLHELIFCLSVGKYQRWEAIVAATEKEILETD